MRRQTLRGEPPRERTSPYHVPTPRRDLSMLVIRTTRYRAFPQVGTLLRRDDRRTQKLRDVFAKDVCGSHCLAPA